LRLARGMAGDRSCRAVDRALAGCARRLGPLRDAHARTLAAGRLASRLPRATRALALDAWRVTGGAVKEAAGGMSADAVRGLVRESRAEIESAREHVLQLDLDAVRWPGIAEALAEACGAARDRFRARWDGRDEEWLHDTRKRAQRAANMLGLLSGQLGQRAVSAERRLREASGLLGDARDAALMLSGMPELPEASPLHAAGDMLRRVASRHRDRCVRRARSVGSAALAEGRGELRRRFARGFARAG
jgi:CHAD domain-containing protein